MNSKKKVITAIIVTAIVGVLTIVGSFALWTTQIGNNINVAFNTVNLNQYIDYTEGKSVFSGNVKVDSAYPEGEEGTYTTFQIKEQNNPAYPFYAALKMKINDIGDILTESRVLKWTVTSKATGTNDSEVVVAESDFVGTKTGDELVLVPNMLVTTTKMDYNVYIWLDSNNSNSSLVSGETINVELWMDVYQYRAPKVLDAYCYDDETTVMCNVVDSEKSFNRYALTTSTSEPNLYSTIISTEYWTSINQSSEPAAHYLIAKTSDSRKTYSTLNQNREGILSGNDPLLVEGLIPIKFTNDTGSSVQVASNSDVWYDYENKKWANAVLVTNDGTHGTGTTREYYLTHPGETIAESDILAYYVWIPRYSYKVWKYSGNSASGQEQTIEIKFVNKNTKEVATANGQWYTHPAFTFGDKELTGIWVGKFEISHDTLSGNTSGLGTCDATNCTNYTGIRILPEKLPLGYNTISKFFYASIHMTDTGNPYGLNSSSVDSHLAKNSEWGAINYLAYSIYGINNISITINSANVTANARTGRGSSASNYGAGTSYPQSTTSNVTGVFDMSGGFWDYVMGVYNKTISASGFSPLPEDKYYDNYPNPPFNGTYNTNAGKCTLVYCGGHALNETYQWFGATTNNFTHGTNSWFLRGGKYNTSPTSSMRFGYDTGKSTGDYGALYVLVEN